MTHYYKVFFEILDSAKNNEVSKKKIKKINKKHFHKTYYGCISARRLERYKGTVG